jgi:hypothetical protein
MLCGKNLTPWSLTLKINTVPDSPKDYVNILQWILTKLGTYLDLKRIWNPIDFQEQRSRSQGLNFRRGDTPHFALPLLHHTRRRCCSLSKAADIISKSTLPWCLWLIACHCYFTFKACTSGSDTSTWFAFHETNCPYTCTLRGFTYPDPIVTTRPFLLPFQYFYLVSI